MNDILNDYGHGNKGPPTKAEIYKEFFESISCLLVEGPEFYNKIELYDSIKSEFKKYIEKLRKID